MKHKKKLIFIPIILIILVFCVYLKNKIFYPKQTVSETSKAEVLKVVQDYYRKYMSTSDYRDSRITENFSKNQTELRRQANAGETTIDADPFLCAQDDVDISKIDVSEITENSAISFVNFVGGGPKFDTGYQAKVSLIKNGKQWLIDDIQCVEKNTIETSKNINPPKFTFNFIDISENSDNSVGTFGFANQPHSIIELEYASKKYHVGTYYGSCNAIEPDQLAVGEISGVNCWFAGAGDELRLIRADDVYKVMHREIDSGSAEIDGFVGEYVQVLEVSENSEKVTRTLDEIILYELEDAEKFDFGNLRRVEVNSHTSLLLVNPIDQNVGYNNESYVFRAIRKDYNLVSVDDIPLIATKDGIKIYSEYEPSNSTDRSLTNARFQNGSVAAEGMRPFGAYPCNIVRTFTYYGDRLIETSASQNSLCKKYMIEVPEDLEKIPQDIIDNQKMVEIYKISPEALEKAKKYKI